MTGAAYWPQFARATNRLGPDDIALLDTLAEAFYARQAMMTSCGFFFEDLDRIEPRILLANARKALLLLEQATGVDLHDPFLERLSQITSARTQRTARDLFHEVARRELRAA